MRITIEMEPGGQPEFDYQPTHEKDPPALGPASLGLMLLKVGFELVQAALLAKAQAPTAQPKSGIIVPEMEVPADVKKMVGQ